MSCPHPTAQYGQTPANAFASLILSETAAASTGSRSAPAPSAPAVAVAPPYFRKSRRERLIDPSLSPLWTRELVPDTTNDDDAARPVQRPLDLHDVACVERGEVGAGAGVIAHHERLIGTGEVGTRICNAFEPDRFPDWIDRDDDVALLLERVRETHAPGLLRVESGTKAGNGWGLARSTMGASITGL